MGIAINKKSLSIALHHLSLSYKEFGEEVGISAKTGKITKFMNPEKYGCYVKKKESDAILSKLNRLSDENKYLFDDIFYFYNK